jgi:hypothetical protein
MGVHYRAQHRHTASTGIAAATRARPSALPALGPGPKS